MLRAVMWIMFATSVSLAQSTAAVEFNIPADLNACVKRAEVSQPYELRTELNPFYLRGLFDSDQVPDYAARVKERSSGKIGILLCLSTLSKPVVIGAGRAFHGMDSFGWMDAWQVVPKGPVEQGVGEIKPPLVPYEKILVEKSESASAIIYWDGRKLHWYQQGD